jgi:hypothetical protein
MASALFSTDATAKRVSMPVGTQPAQPGLAKSGLPTAAADPAALDAQRAEAYAAQKERAQQQGNAAKTQNNEALKRRFAAIGNLNSGAFVKAAGQADQVSDANTQAAVKDIEMAQNNEKYSQNEAEKGRIFNRELFDKDQAFKQMTFDSDVGFKNANLALQQKGLDLQEKDLNASLQANKLNAGTAIANLSDGALRNLGGVQDGYGGKNAEQLNLAAILKKYGYA